MNDIETIEYEHEETAEAKNDEETVEDEHE